MENFKKHFVTLMENVDMNYQPPVQEPIQEIDPNSGQGLTKFAPSPASKVLKSYNVDDSFMRSAMSWAGGQPQAIDQVLGALGQNTDSGTLGGGHFDGIIAKFNQPEIPAEVPAIPGPETSMLSPVDSVAPIATDSGISNVSADATPPPVDSSTATTVVDPATGPTTSEPPALEPEAGEVGADETPDVIPSEEKPEEKPII